MKTHFAYTVSPNGKRREVKNLGWLLRNWRTLERMEFRYAPDSQSVIDGELVSFHSDGVEYHSSYSSLGVFWNWVNRPIFKGVPLDLIHDVIRSNYIIGDERFTTINRMEYKEQLAALLA